MSFEELGIIHLPCVGRVGDANGVGGDEPTIGDISTMIDGVFIASDCEPVITSLDEADVNQSGPPDNATCYNITIGDISILIVDDVPVNVTILSDVLGDDYEVRFALNGLDGVADQFHHQHAIDVRLDDRPCVRVAIDCYTTQDQKPSCLFSRREVAHGVSPIPAPGHQP